MKVEFLDKSGAVVDTQTTTVGPLAPGRVEAGEGRDGQVGRRGALHDRRRLTGRPASRAEPGPALAPSAGPGELSGLPMRKLLLLVGVLLAAHVAFLFVRPAAPPSRPPARGSTSASSSTSAGAATSRSTTAPTPGAMRAARELGARVRFIEPGEGSDREAGLRLLAAEGMDLVVGVGFIFTDDLTQLAKEYPNVRFAGSTWRSPTTRPAIRSPRRPTWPALKFREEQGSYLVGALAALLSRETRIGDRAYRPTTRIGFVGGMDIPLIHKFEAGYRAGVARVCPDCQVIAQYAGVTPRPSAIRDAARRSRSASTSRGRT
jgi:basic membrane lipoprotein Med (substrate-binding protein (PBP1-ABC) superfamily)